MIFFGSFPPPYGGVSEYTIRFYQNFPKYVSLLVVRTSTTDRIPFVGRAYKVYNLIGLFVTAFFLKFKNPKKIFYFNFSTLRSIAFLAFLPFKSRSIVVFHNGNVDFPRSYLLKHFIVWILNRHLAVVALNSIQSFVYRKNGVDEKRIFLHSSWLPPLNLIRKKKFDCFDIFFSGMDDPLYQIDLGLNYLIRNPEISGCLVTYGKLSGKLLDNINHCKDINNKFIHYHEIESLKFQDILSRSKILFRPTLIDSVGLSVYDAYFFGLQIIASNVCDRPEGSLTFEPSDHITAYSLLDRYLLDPPKPISIRFDWASAKIDEFDNIYKNLLSD